MRPAAIVILFLLGACGIKGDPLPVEREDPEPSTIAISGSAALGVSVGALR